MRYLTNYDRDYEDTILTWYNTRSGEYETECASTTDLVVYLLDYSEQLRMVNEDYLPANMRSFWDANALEDDDES